MPAKTIYEQFVHRHSAHCESGAAANLFFNYGINISEALVFGISSGFFFGYFPFFKVQGLPLITYRNIPGLVLRNTAKRLGVVIKSEKFSDPGKAMDTLDNLLDKGTPVCLQTGIFWLPYYPDSLRFHFNAHTLIAFGKKGNSYLISDPVFDEPVECPRDALIKARFARGALAPRGKMYHVEGIPDRVDFSNAISKGIRATWRMVVKTPFPYIGVRGIRTLAGDMQKWPARFGEQKASLHLGNVIRMQEEIGTGGGGFRLMYAAFLQESAHILNNNHLLDMSRRMTEIGDSWREFAVLGARICKNRSSDREGYHTLSHILLDCADRERQFFNDLSEIIK